MSNVESLSDQIGLAVNEILAQDESLTSQDLVTAFSNLIIDTITQTIPEGMSTEDTMDRALQQADYIIKCLGVYQKKHPVPVGVQVMALSMATMYLSDISEGDEKTA